jgi:hypothetical protein
MRASLAARIALGLTLALALRPASAQADRAAGAPPDISGTYRTRHPNEEWGDVLVRFDPSSDLVGFEGVEYPSWSVSIWKDSGGSYRKLRDGLFGSYAIASVVRRHGGLALLWRGRDGARDRFNEILSVGADGSLEIGAQDSEDAGDRVFYRLEYAGVPGWPAGREAPLDPAGVYDYYSDATGRVKVALSPVESRIPLGRGGSLEAYSVRIVRDLGGSRFAPAREGLFGGSRSRDGYTLVGVDRTGGVSFLVWHNPARPRDARRDRIVCAYENGDIAIGQGRGDLEYVEGSLFRKIAGPEARIGDAASFLDPAGVYEVSLWPAYPTGAGKTLARIVPTAVSLGARPIFRLEAIDLVEGRAVARHPGLDPADPFGHIALRSIGGSCRVSFVDFASGREEEFEAVDIGLEGSFSLTRTSERRAGGAQAIVARFERKEARGRDPAGQAASLPVAWRLDLSQGEEPAWTAEEERALESAAALLPPDLFADGRIAVVRARGAFVLGGGTGGGPLVEVSKARRELGIKRFAVAEGYPVDADGAYEAYLRRALVHSLALMRYESLDPARKKEWASFNLWKSSLFSQPEPLNTNPEGFADPLGRGSPAEDFACFAEDVFLRPRYKDPMSSARNRMSDRYAFFRTLFPSLQAAPGEPVAAGAETFRDWIDPDEVERLELVVTTPTSTSIESIAGHILLLVKREGDYEDCGDSLVLGFVGEIARDKANGIGGLAYVARGLTGYYRSLIQEESFDSLARRATLVENRDVLRLRLRMSRAEIERLIERLWVLKRTFTYKYYFFTGNCVSMLLDALDFAFLDGGRIEARGVVAPMYVVARLAYAGRIEGFSYPVRRSVLGMARRATRDNGLVAGEMIGLLREAEARLKGSGSAGAIGAIRSGAAAAIDLASSPGAGAIVSDPLFRTPVISREGPDRCAAYRRLAELCGDLRAARLAESAAISREDYLRYAGLTERFLLNAVDRELYIAVPTELKKAYGRDDIALMENVEDIAERRLYKLRSRQQNSAEIRAIQFAISSLRLSTEGEDPTDDLYTLGRRMREERDARAAEGNESADFSQGYYAKRILASWRIADGRQEASLGYETALYRGEMGDGSFCSLKRDMRLTLLDGTIEASYALDDGLSSIDAVNTSLRTSGVAAEIEKISTGTDADYRGFLSGGFALAFMRSSGRLWDGERLFPRRDMHLTIVEARYLLNLFEIDDFLYYANIGMGAGLQRRRDDGVESWNATVPFGLDLKLRLPGLSGNALRARVDWELRFPFAGPPSSTLAAEAETMLTLDRRANAGIGARASLVVDEPADWSGAGRKMRELKISAVYRM